MSVYLVQDLNDPAALGEIDQLEGHLQSRLNGRVHELHLVRRQNGLVLQGHAPTYYTKQLAQHAFMEATQWPLLANEIQVL
jgi:hypothetical protein